ncbi:Na+/H+ antiporter NhaC family protein [uncultured Ruminococcus sp.]|uniref:Na+/H+ antiporter NhaC family protein n=1 Tax=uncultured Ruminococcus sp. TaxID=165186 RepID=UPI002930DF5F|nr:Na+/H+ antiporter NhaC family protein [uncultured Ruminococcus sp.]
MSKTNKIVLAIAAVVIVGLLIYVAVSGGALGTIKCQDCGGTGLIDGADCETCGGEGAVRGSAWALLPPIIAIGLALITKEVYSSLAVGIVVGGLMYSNFNFLKAMDAITSDGLISAVSDTAGIFIFLVELGIIVALINKAGGSRAFGKWAAKHIKTRTGAMLATFVLGVLIFIDDYFNCLTVGSVMKPVTDGHKVSRAKLAYLIDATAAPVCMIAPVSSWAAAVASYADEGQGLKLFINAIPYNFYSLLTFVFIIGICVMGFDYGSMAIHEFNAMYKDDLYTTGDRVDTELENEGVNENGKVIDLILPVLVLIGVSVFALVYNGGILEGASFIDAFGNTDATVGLPWAGAIALVFTIVYLMLRKIVNFKEAMEQVPKGFFAMVPPILILTFATALKNMTTMMGAKYFVADMMSGAAASLQNFLPAIIFLVACLLAFATGTSWGTFGILIPIVLSIFTDNPTLQIIGISACLAGAVCGDHCSPISDTTIMSSAGAQCNHINHVSTQLPYAITVAAVSFVSFIIAGFVQSWYICLPVGIALMIGTLLVIKFTTKNRREAMKSEI